MIMKTILLSLALVASLMFGSTLALADTSAQHGKQTIQTMSAQSGKADRKKGLSEALVVPNGQESWILHQPVERYPQYFNSAANKKMVDESSNDQDRQRG